MSERIDLRNGWFITKHAHFEIYWVNHPKHGEIFSFGGSGIEPEMREFIAAITPSDARAGKLDQAALRKEVMRLMREDFDPTPPGWEGREWDDNAEDVADKVMALFAAPSDARAGD